MGVAEDLEALAVQERELRFNHFDEEVAWKFGVRLRDLAITRWLSVVIDIRRFGGFPLFYCALGGTSPDNAEWVRRKSNVVARFHRSSYAVGLELKQKESTLAQKYGLPEADYSAHGGSFPLIVINAGVIGSITLSGRLPQRADHELVVEALCAELNRDYAALALPSIV